MVTSYLTLSFTSNKATVNSVLTSDILVTKIISLLVSVIFQINHFYYIQFQLTSYYLVFSDSFQFSYYLVSFYLVPKCPCAIRIQQTVTKLMLVNIVVTAENISTMLICLCVHNRCYITQCLYSYSHVNMSINFHFQPHTHIL